MKSTTLFLTFGAITAAASAVVRRNTAEEYYEDNAWEYQAVGPDDRKLTESLPPTSLPVPTPPFTSRMNCGLGEKSVKIVFEGDQYMENKWEVVDRNSGVTVWQSKDYKSCVDDWQSCNREIAERCLPAGDYDFNFYDEIGDGCPKLEIHMESSYGWGYDKIYGLCRYGKEWTQQFHTRTVQLSARDSEWLTAHNVRRAKYWFENGLLQEGSNPYYVPMRWDPVLAEQARVHAEALLEDCTLHHDLNRGGAGENMASNNGATSSEFGQMYSADDVVTRFVEKEFDGDYGARYHMTQALWKASMYVGCGDAVKTYTVNGNEHQCHTQICRYVAPGNCDVNGDEGSENYDLFRIMANPEEQNCGSRWPPLGVYAA